MSVPDPDLAAALKQAKAKPMFFAFVVKGPADGTLLVDKVKPPPARVQEAKDKTGGTTVYRGRCFFEDGQIVFETDKEPPPALAAALKAVAKRDAGMALTVQTRLAAEEGETAAAPAAAAAGPSLVHLQKSRLVWDAARKVVRGELTRLEKAVLETCAGAETFDDIAEGVKNLYEILEDLDERLIDTLDDALNAPTPEARQRLHARARGLVTEYRDYVATEPLVQDIDDNGFVAVKVRATLTATLETLAKNLA